MEDPSQSTDNEVDQDALDDLAKRVAVMEKFVDNFTIRGDGISGNGEAWEYNPPEADAQDQ